MEKEKDIVEINVENLEQQGQEEGVTVEKAEETSAEVNKPEHSPEEVLKQLRANLEAERNARIQAQQQAQHQSEIAHRSRTEVASTNLQLVSNAIDTVRRENEILKANYRSALSQSDFDTAAEAQERMSMNSAKLLQLENGKAAMEAEPKQRQEVREIPRNIDPVEAFASKLTPRSASWVRRNPQFVTDERLNQKMVAAHNLALADGHKADSDSYFSSVEDTLKFNRRNETSENEESSLSTASSPAQRRASPPAAPVSRSGTANGTRSDVVRLTAAEREMAEMMGMSHTDYAKNKLALQKEGKLN
jgi:hypothetical protein